MLCNQIRQGRLTPASLRVFDAFSPDGYADRFERQVPIYVVPAAPGSPPILMPRKVMGQTILAATPAVSGTTSSL